jgi:hypothetical protein
MLCDVFSVVASSVDVRKGLRRAPSPNISVSLMVAVTRAVWSNLSIKGKYALRSMADRDRTDADPGSGLDHEAHDSLNRSPPGRCREDDILHANA